MNCFLKMRTYRIDLSEELTQVCEGRVKSEEISEVLNSSKDNKVPGIDGLPSEFYKTFWHLLGDSLVESFIEGV